MEAGARVVVGAVLASAQRCPASEPLRQAGSPNQHLIINETNNDQGGKGPFRVHRNACNG